MTQAPEWAARVALEWELCQLTEEAKALRTKLDAARSEGEAEEVMMRLDELAHKINVLARHMP
jgi:hypothetical protein